MEEWSQIVMSGMKGYHKVNNHPYVCTYDANHIIGMLVFSHAAQKYSTFFTWGSRSKRHLNFWTTRVQSMYVPLSH